MAKGINEKTKSIKKELTYYDKFENWAKKNDSKIFYTLIVPIILTISLIYIIWSLIQKKK